jgi:phosphoglycerate dehydrogenase-like enzyme
VLTISLPAADAQEYVGDLPPDVEIIVWDGTGAPPDGADRIQLFVGLYNAPPPPRDTFTSLRQLQVIQLVSAGVEPWLPVVPDGVVLCNGRGVHGASTAELAVGGMLAVLRRLPEFLDQQRAETWEPRNATGLTGRRVLVVGAGDIGRRIAAAARVFDATAHLVARSARDEVSAIADLPLMLPIHDVVAIAVPHTPDTHHMVDAAFLAAMPNGALLVNIARGAIVDTDALVDELTAGRLHAFLDVTDPEPLPAGHPLWTAPNLVLTPHVGGGTRGWERRAYLLVREQVLRFHAGEPLQNRVEHGY